MLRAWSIRTQLLGLSFAVALPAAALIAWNIYDAARHSQDMANARARDVAVAIAGDLDQVLRENEALLRRIAERPAVRALDPRRCDPAVRDYIELNPLHTTLAVRDLLGNSVCSYLPNPLGAEHISSFAWFREGLRNGGFTAGDAFFGYQSGRWVAVLTYPIRGERGDIAGLIALPLDLARLHERIMKGVPAGAIAGVQDRGGYFLMRSQEHDAWVGKPGRPPDLSDAVWREREGSVRARGVDGVARLYAYTTAASADWRVFAGIPEDIAFADHRRRLARSVLFGMLVLLGAAAAGWAIAGAIAAPIRGLAATARAVATGEASARAAEAGALEVAAVAREFNRMLDASGAARRTLEASELRLRTAISTGDVWDWNPLTGEGNFPVGMMRALGYDAAETEIATTPAAFEALLHPDDRDRWRTALFAHLRDRAPYELQYRARAKSGGYRWFETRGQAARDATGRATYMAGTVFDITELKQSQQRAARLSRLYSASYETSSALLRLRTREQVFDAACRIVVTHGGLALARVWLAEKGSDPLRLACQSGAACEPSLPHTSAAAASAMQAKRQVLCDDLAAADAPFAGCAAACRYGCRAAAATPIESGGRAIGALTVCSSEAGFFDEEVASLLRMVAADVAFALGVIEAEQASRRQSERLEALSSRLLGVHEAERAAIARELHDEIGQSLTALKLMAQAAARGAAGAQAAKLAQCVDIADRVLAQTRNLTFDLRPPQLDQLGLVAALRDTLDRMCAPAGLEAHFSAEPDEIALAPALATTAYRVAQEALTNAVRHAGARRVAIELRAARGELVLAVSDDGGGYDREAARARTLAGASTGLLGMEERVALAGGRLDILTRPGQGTRVQAVFPLEPAAAPNERATA